MSKDEIDSLVAKRDTLTNAEAEELANAILMNPTTNDIACGGTLSEGNIPLALFIATNTKLTS